jgi:hypothetical protein
MPIGVGLNRFLELRDVPVDLLALDLVRLGARVLCV